MEDEDIKVAWVNLFNTRFGLIVAACDRALLGKPLRNKDIEIKVSEEFYGGRLVDESALESLLLKADVLNLIGSFVVNKALSLNLLHEDSIIFFEDESGIKIPHVQVYRFML